MMWIVIFCVFVFSILIIFGIVEGARAKFTNRKHAKQHLDLTARHVRSGIFYNVVLNDGRRFEQVRVVGSLNLYQSAFETAGQIPGDWIILESTEKKIFLRPGAIRFYEQITMEPNQASLT